MSWVTELVKDEGRVLEIAERFRTATKYCEVDFNHKLLLNNIGKAINAIMNLAVKYRYAKDEEKKEILEKSVKILSCIEKIVGGEPHV